MKELDWNNLEHRFALIDEFMNTFNDRCFSCKWFGAERLAALLHPNYLAGGFCQYLPRGYGGDYTTFGTVTCSRYKPTSDEDRIRVYFKNKLGDSLLNSGSYKRVEETWG